MIALDIIKQAIESNAQKPAISSNITKKLAISKLNTSINVNCDWQLRDEISSILSSKLPDEEKTELISNLKSLAYDSYNKMKSELNSLFGVEEKQASVEADKQSGEKEEIAKASEGASSEEAQDDPKDDKKTPAEHVIEQKPGQSIFNY